MTLFLTVQQILFTHSQLINSTGGEHGLRDLGLLQSAVSRPMASFDGEELYPDIFQKTAALMQSLSQNHPFLDGNKRTAITSAGMFLILNGYQLQTTNSEIERFSMRVAAEKPSFDDIALWFNEHSTATQNKGD